MTADTLHAIEQRAQRLYAYEGKTVKDFLIELAEARLQELERKGILQKGK